MKNLTRLEWIEKRNPKKGKKIREKLKKIREARENKDKPSLAWTKVMLTEFAEAMDPPIEVLSTWTKQDIFDAITGENKLETPDMSWNKATLTEFAEAMDPPIEVSSSWTKQEILDAIEAAE